MSRTHLSHKIPWQDLVQCCQVPDPSTVYLPIGQCGFIHCPTKATEIIIKNRDYINKLHICRDPDCQVDKLKGFGKKNKKREINLDVARSVEYQKECRGVMGRFVKKLFDGVMEFASTEEKKFGKMGEALKDEDLVYEELDRYYYPSENDRIVLILFLKCEVGKLLKLHNTNQINIAEAFQRLYGGQAVGCGFQFLMHYHILPFYVISNAIIASNYQTDPTKWGKLSQGYFSQSLHHDCDFLTFIPHLRPYIADGVFMVDLEKTDELLKILFRYICMYALLCKKIYQGDFESYFLDVLQGCIGSSFKLYHCFDE